MPRAKAVVTFNDADPARIPELLSEAALLLNDLDGRGLIEAVGDRLHIQRQGGYPAVDIWIAILAFLASTATMGLRPFWSLVRAHSAIIAALAGRKRIPSPASVSRALDSADVAHVRENAFWMLNEAPGARALLGHPAMMAWDTCGQPWHVFDVDPTVKTLRHRALPVGDDLPDALRRSAETGAPGHSGRKRGDIQYRRVDVQHAGSGLWTHAHLHTGNGDGAVDLGLALDSVVALVQSLNHPLERTLVRMDGEHGSVPYYAACRERRLPFVTRLNRPKLYEDPVILDRMRQAVWCEVPDSGSGPRRAAADLGVLTVHPDAKTRRPDGGRYEPVQVRVVASAYPTDKPAQRGKVLDGWQVELFAADVPVDAWPAPEVIALYFGRASQENRFAQEDREVGLDRIVSYHLPGQELATLIGLFLMNYRIARGFDLEAPPHFRPEPTLRRAAVDARIPPGWPRDPVIVAMLRELDWRALLARQEGWSFDARTGEVVCADGRRLALTTARQRDDRSYMIFCRPQRGCDDCGPRKDCFTSKNRAAAKHVEFTVSREAGDAIRARLALVRGKVEPDHRVDLRPPEGEPGLRAVITPRFLPAEARRRHRQLFVGATLRVEVDMPPSAPPRPRLVAADEPARQHRRLTWAERVARYALPERAEVRLEVTGSWELRRMLATASSEIDALGGAS